MFGMMVFAIFLSACSESYVAGSTLSSFYDAAGRANMEAALTLVSSSGGAQSSGNPQTLFDETKKLIQDNGGLDSVKVLNIKMDESAKIATVEALLKFKNGKEQTDTRRVFHGDDGEWKILP
jgi:hypothetical protein